MKTDVPLQLRIGGVVLLILGPVLALFSAGLYLQSRQALGWPTVDARVTQSQVDVSKKASGFRRSRTSFADYYTAVIRYEYVVNGQRFIGRRVALDASPSSGFDREDAERWVRRYPVGATLRIHYSPHDPEQSVIDPSSDRASLGLVVGLGVLAIPAGLVLRRIARQLQPVEPPAAPVPQSAAAPIRDGASPPVAPEVAALSPPPEIMLFRVPVVAPAAPLPFTKQAAPEEARPTHWLIRTLAIVTGLPLFLFGCIALNVSVKLALREGNAPSHGAISIAVHLAMIAIMGGVTLLGAFLVWKGAKRRRRARPRDG
jgi:hypothetical protein